MLTTITKHVKVRNMKEAQAIANVWQSTNTDAGTRLIGCKHQHLPIW